MRKLRAGQLTAIAVLTAAAPFLLPAPAAVDGAVPGAGVRTASPVDGPGGPGGPGDGPACCVPKFDAVQPAVAGRFAHVELRDVDGRSVAWVDLAKVSSTLVVVTVRARGLTPGFHGLHIHAKGVCDPSGPTPFASAGPHFNPTGTEEGMQAGAFPVLLVAPDGSANAAFTDGNFALDQLTGPDGTSVVLHSGPDNYANIPSRYSAGGVAGPDAETKATGDAGRRFACGVISAPGTGRFVQGWKSHAWT